MAIRPMPGVGGNQLLAKLNKPSTVHYICDSTSDFYTLWLNPWSVVLPGFSDCWVDNMQLYYNKRTRTSDNSPGVVVSIGEFGRPNSMEWIDPSVITRNVDFGAYFIYILNSLLDNGYERMRTLFGAPYDFRRGPNENVDWFSDLKDLVEYAYKLNANTPVTFVVHSMGGPMLLHFLQLRSQQWKDKYIARAITLNAAWGGTVQSIEAIAEGYNFGSTVIKQSQMRQIQRSSPSLHWLMPHATFWAKDDVLMTTRDKNYTVDNYKDLFYDVGNPNGWEIMKDLADYKNSTAPGIEVHCVHGTKVGTLERLEYTDGYGSSLSRVNGDGDGTVNIRSLLGCTQWQNAVEQAGHPIYHHDLDYAEHYDILKDPRAINYMLKALMGTDDFVRPTPLHTDSRTILEELKDLKFRFL